MSEIINRLMDLHKQATEDYTGSVLREAIAYIQFLEKKRGQPEEKGAVPSDLDRVYQVLATYGVPRERAGSAAIGVQVLAARYQKAQFDDRLALLRARIGLQRVRDEGMSMIADEIAEEALKDTAYPDDHLPRKSLLWFVQEMEKVLRANDEKGGWAECTDGVLADLQEIDGVIGHIRKTLNLTKPEDAIKAATDIANFVMMIADNARRRLEGQGS